MPSAPCASRWSARRNSICARLPYQNLRDVGALDGSNSRLIDLYRQSDGRRRLRKYCPVRPITGKAQNLVNLGITAKWPRKFPGRRPPSDTSGPDVFVSGNCGGTPSIWRADDYSHWRSRHAHRDLRILNFLRRPFRGRQPTWHLSWIAKLLYRCRRSRWRFGPHSSPSE